mmetsp:Transcript_18397/g.25310  ORF Transcript_18397/g.25310 Transcript_18397/m.25310 type:complete len:170 (-) Transcript_18397:376-885(-)|eukprot:CAMPEP_0185730378 /NCGR_PEP_ID=MMETSP1171-20130828/9711_1 /TAXON_ID=374046 /ORGANISM="Helicotheca tamensis, Strain CCMP826" /LENGTH=169 /DNA_ID=CAMNT_0028399409 /DNA_START=201 /DNA_END=710 /DNA_ORIENTATION=-
MLSSALLRSTSRAATRRAPAATASVSRRGGAPSLLTKRRMGGGQPESQSMKAELWEGHSKEPEGWETAIYFTYAVGFVVIGMTLSVTPETSIKTWASNEAQARLDLLRAGKIDKVEFGTHYNTSDRMYDFESQNPDNPFNEEEEDEDEDDDDDDEDDEEDDDEEDDDDE